MNRISWRFSPYFSNRFIPPDTNKYRMMCFVHQLRWVPNMAGLVLYSMISFEPRMQHTEWMAQPLVCRKNGKQTSKSVSGVRHQRLACYIWRKNRNHTQKVVLKVQHLLCAVDYSGPIPRNWGHNHKTHQNQKREGQVLSLSQMRGHGKPKGTLLGCLS